MKASLEYDGGTVYQYHKSDIFIEPLPNLPDKAIIIELYACCIDYCWYSWFWVDGNVELLKRPGGQALSGQLVQVPFVYPYTEKEIRVLDSSGPVEQCLRRLLELTEK